MKKTWLWILGIILVLVVVAALVAVPFVMRNHMLALNAANSLPQSPNGNIGPMMHGDDGWQHPRVPGYRGGFGGRGFNRGFAFNGRFPGFGFGLGLLGGLFRLIPLALFALLLFGVYQLGKRSGSHSSPAPTATSTVPAPAPDQPAPPQVAGSENNEPPSI